MVIREGAKQSQEDQSGATEPLKDPVCGMDIIPSRSYGATYSGREYRFCSLACLDKFKADPGALVQR
jgi:P-type Cu+ transporter